jgi:phosphate transport system permease protein
MLNGIPSIVIGLFAYTLIVLPMKHFSALAGGVALGIMMIPTVMRTSEEMLLLVPHTLREAAFALGIPYWRTLASIVLKTARGGIITGALLAIARISGETAPLLFTALGNHYWAVKLTEPIAAMPLQIFAYAISPFEAWQAQAWAGALVLIGLVFVLNVSARLFIRDKWRGKA